MAGGRQHRAVVRPDLGALLPAHRPVAERESGCARAVETGVGDISVEGEGHGGGFSPHAPAGLAAPIPASREAAFRGKATGASGRFTFPTLPG